MCRVLCVLFVVILGSAAERFPKGYGTDNSAYLHHNEDSELDYTQKKFKSNIRTEDEMKEIGLTETKKEGVINLCSTSDNGEDKNDHISDRNIKTDSVSVTDDEEKLDERYMKMTDDSNRNGCKNSDKQVNSSSKSDNDFTISKSETTLINSDTAPNTISWSGNSYITEKSRIDENSSNTATSASNIGKTENDCGKVKKPSYSSSFSIIEQSSDGLSSSNNFKTEITSTDSETKHLLTVDSSSDASLDKQIDIFKVLGNNGYESLVLTTISNIPLVNGIAVKEEIKSSTFKSNNEDQNKGSNNFKIDAKSDEKGQITTGLPLFVASGINVKNEFKTSSNTNNAQGNSESLSNSYSNFQTDRKSTNLDENIAVATDFSVLKSKDGGKNSIDTGSSTSSDSLIESTFKTPYAGGSKLDTKDATILIKSDNISHDVHTGDNKINATVIDEHFKSTTESINHQNNYSAANSPTTGDHITIVKPKPSNKEVNKNEHISEANYKNKVQIDKMKENSSSILIIVGQYKYGRFEIDKGGLGHRYSHESDSSDSSDESDESWEKNHNRHHEYDGHHYSHESDSSDSSDESDSSDDSSIESNESWVEGHNFRFYGHEQ